MLKQLFSRLTQKHPANTRQIANHTLYHYVTCPYCFKVRFAMTQLGIDMELRNIHQSLQHLNDLTQGGGRKTVPCLRIESDSGVQWMYESDDIVAYLEREFG